MYIANSNIQGRNINKCIFIDNQIFQVFYSEKGLKKLVCLMMAAGWKLKKKNLILELKKVVKMSNEKFISLNICLFFSTFYVVKCTRHEMSKNRFRRSVDYISQDSKNSLVSHHCKIYDLYIW